MQGMRGRFLGDFGHAVRLAQVAVDALDERALTPQAVNLIVKRRCVLAGLDPANFSAHGLRSGYLTEAALRGVSLPEAMQQSQHRSVQQAASYYNDGERRQGKGARLALSRRVARLRATSGSWWRPRASLRADDAMVRGRIEIIYDFEKARRGAKRAPRWPNPPEQRII